MFTDASMQQSSKQCQNLKFALFQEHMVVTGVGHTGSNRLKFIVFSCFVNLIHVSTMPFHWMHHLP